MKLFISTSCLKGGANVVDVVKKYVNSGIKNIELGSSHIYHNNLKHNLKLEDVTYLVHNYFPPSEKPIILNLASLDAEILNNSIEFVKKSLDFCKAMGIKLYSIHGGFSADSVGVQTGKKGFRFDSRLSVPKKEAFSVFIESIRNIGRYASKLGIDIAVENQGSGSKDKYLLMCEAEEFITLFKKVSLNNIGILLDLGHLNIASAVRDFDKYEFINQLKDRAFGIHLHNNDGFVDDHKKIVNECWFFDGVLKEDFWGVPIVLEVFNLTMEEIVSQIELIEPKMM